MEWYWTWYQYNEDSSHICAASVWIWNGGIKKNLGTFFSKFSPNLFRKAVYIEKDWAVTYLR